MRDLRGKNAVIVGASSGIGRAMAIAFAKEGMNIVIAGTNRGRLDELAEDLRARGVRATPVVCDVSSRIEVRALADQAFAEYGAVHLLCNNAGVTTVGPLVEHSDDDWDWIYGVVLMGVAYAIQAFVPRMIKQGEGHIVNTGSQAGLVPDWVTDHGPYTSAKAGVIALTVALRPEVEKHGLGVSLFIPAAVNTEIVKGSGRKRPDRYGGAKAGEETRTPVMRDGAPLPLPNTRFVLEPDEAAGLVVRGVKENRPFIVTHGGLKPLAEDYFGRILSAYDVALAEQ